MKLEIGIKADPIQYRYSYPWLFKLMDKLDVRNLQFGSFFEMYSLPDRYFQRIRSQAEDYGIAIRSCFTTHRELGGFFFEDDDMQQVAMKAYRRYIEIGVLLGADSVGSNPGSVLRDKSTVLNATVCSRWSVWSRTCFAIWLKDRINSPISFGPHG